MRGIAHALLRFETIGPRFKTRLACAVSDDFARGRRRLRDYAGPPLGCALLLRESVRGHRSLMMSATSKGRIGPL